MYLRLDFMKYYVVKWVVENYERKWNMKSKRQEKIIEIIETQDIETQDELAEKLQEAGFQTTQATISRDIREMKLTKIAAQSGKQKYIALKDKDYHTTEKYKRVLADGVLSLESAQNLIVIKTVVGMAMAVAAAIDNLHMTGIMGCIAGDDTIFCVTKDDNMAKEVIKNIKKLAVHHTVR